MTIALVEDDEAVLDSLSLLLKPRGMDTQAFTSADAFSPPGDDYRPACILSDVRLPAWQIWNSRLPKALDIPIPPTLLARLVAHRPQRHSKAPREQYPSS
jgi:CheY-like chemotaxis protein